ncbi:MAG: hypothetical protein PHW75_01725 [Patescibacteria group bacterium]|nr:hypothetical protein [Patescibacteria group bacterium]
MNISWDLFVLLVFGAFTVYGALIGRNKILGILVNLYIALAVVLLAGDVIYSFASNFSLITNNFVVTEFGAKTISLVVITGLLTIKSEVSGLDSGNSIGTVMTAVYGFLTAGLFLAAAFSFMSLTERIALDSNFANMVYNFRALFALAPVTLMIVTSFTRRR